jgi:hypothetical protein
MNLLFSAASDSVAGHIGQGACELDHLVISIKVLVS